MTSPSVSIPLRANTYYSNEEREVMVPHTTVNVVQEMPKDHIIWSLLCCLYYNPCCMGLIALIHSVKARDRKVLGDIEGARKHGSASLTLNTISTIFFCITIIIIIVLTVMFSPIDQIVYLLKNSGANYGGYGRGFSG